MKELTDSFDPVSSCYPVYALSFYLRSLRLSHEISTPTGALR
jgi:hypothetical protein